MTDDPEHEHARQAEVARLGANGQQRVDAVAAWVRSSLGEADAVNVVDQLRSAEGVKAWERIIHEDQQRKNSASTQQKQTAPAQTQPADGRVSEEVFQKMSGAERLDYCRNFAQPLDTGIRS